ncbi:uncharacterized protein fit [Drosophila bipectinata]|uniref:uncharacterized protein fit n=1 Tax=Drosophila bipectinata TaxID=42026 RepID=UPI001C8A535F|nr:uncharacterized protein LOC108129442 [Drosophila bipectinata]
MRCTLVLLFIPALVLRSCLSRTISSTEKSLESSGLTSDESIVWPTDLIHFPQAYTLMHKVEKRLERIGDEESRNRIMNHTVDELRKCKLDFQMYELCIKRSVPFTMSFISNQQRKQILVQRRKDQTLSSSE